MATETQFLQGVASLYLHKGHKRFSFRAYGLFITSDKLIGVNLPAKYRIFGVLPSLTILAVGLSLLSYSEVNYLAIGNLIPFFNMTLLLLVIVSIPLALLMQSQIENRLKAFSKLPLARILETRDFEASRAEISNIELVYPRYNPGHIRIMTKSGETKIWFNKPERRMELIVDVWELLSRFCGQEPKVPFAERGF